MGEEEPEVVGRCWEALCDRMSVINSAAGISAEESAVGKAGSPAGAGDVTINCTENVALGQYDVDREAMSA